MGDESIVVVGLRFRLLVLSDVRLEFGSERIEYDLRFFERMFDY